MGCRRVSLETFEKVFLNAMRKTMVSVVKDPEIQASLEKKLQEKLRNSGIPSSKVLGALDDICSYVFGSLAADIAIASIIEGNSESQKIQKIVADAVIEVAGDKGVKTLLEHCNVPLAKEKFGEEKIEEIAERVTTTSLYEVDEFKEFCEILKAFLQESLKKRM